MTGVVNTTKPDESCEVGQLQRRKNSGRAEELSRDMCVDMFGYYVNTLEFEV